MTPSGCRCGSLLRRLVALPDRVPTHPMCHRVSEGERGGREEIGEGDRGGKEEIGEGSRR